MLVLSIFHPILQVQGVVVSLRRRHFGLPLKLELLFSHCKVVSLEGVLLQGWVVVPGHVLRVALRYLPVVQSPHVVFVIHLARLGGHILLKLPGRLSDRDFVFCFVAIRSLQCEVLVLLDCLLG